MEDYMKKKKVREALEKARALEKEKIPTPEEDLKRQKEATSLSEKLRKLLQPAWFVSDVHKKKTTKKTLKKKAKKKKVKKKKKAVKKKKK
jgi:hypothetical protein